MSLPIIPFREPGKRHNTEKDIAKPADDHQRFLAQLAHHLQIAGPMGSSAIGAIHCRLADRTDMPEIVESLARQLRSKRTKCKA
jgi:hypothetical protein